jgi:hypothetical protein
MSLPTFAHLLLGAALAGLPLRVTVGQEGIPRPVSIPAGRAALADGRLEPGEWADARELAAAPGVRLYLKHDEQFLYLAVVRAPQAFFGVNLYLGAGETADYLNLHASAKLGERRGRAGAWPDWAWWNNDGWAANLTRGVSFEERRFLPDTAKEFQIRRRRLPGREFVMSLDLETADGVTPLLPEAPERDGLRWLTLRL